MTLRMIVEDEGHETSKRTLLEVHEDIEGSLFKIDFQPVNSEDSAMEKEKIGIVSNYYSKISVAAVELTDGSVSLEDTLHFLGYVTNFESKVDSMQIEHKSVSEAKKGDSVGIKIPEKARRGDRVYKVVKEAERRLQ